MYNNKYYINLLHTSINGIHLGFFGTIDSSKNRFEFCKDKDKDDYKIITNWINTHSTSTF